jgi:hypothetical protein
MFKSRKIGRDHVRKRPIDVEDASDEPGGDVDKKGDEDGASSLACIRAEQAIRKKLREGGGIKPTTARLLDVVNSSVGSSSSAPSSSSGSGNKVLGSAVPSNIGSQFAASELGGLQGGDGCDKGTSEAHERLMQQYIQERLSTAASGKSSGSPGGGASQDDGPGSSSDGKSTDPMATVLRQMKAGDSTLLSAAAAITGKPTAAESEAEAARQKEEDRVSAITASALAEVALPATIRLKSVIETEEARKRSVISCYSVFLTLSLVSCVRLWSVSARVILSTLSLATTTPVCISFFSLSFYNSFFHPSFIFSKCYFLQWWLRHAL